MMVLLLSCIDPVLVQADTGPDTSADTRPDSPADTDSAPDTGSAPDTDPEADTITASADCLLVSDLATPWLQEGDLLSFTLSCSGSMDTDSVTISPARLPSEAVFDAEALTVSWQTGAADGGRLDMVFSVLADPGEIPTAATITVWVADNPDLADAIPPDPLTYTEEWGLPVVFVDVESDMNQTDQDAVVYFGGKEYAAEAKIRGASSASYPKPSYTIELTEDELDLQEQWGESRNHLILLTTFDDNSYVRQKLVYDLWAAMAQYWGEDRLTPRTFFSVLYLNGEYRGLYVALDRVDNEFIKHMGFDDSGNLFKAVNHDANFYLTDSGGSWKDTLHDGYEKKEGTPEDDFSDLDDLVEFTGNSDASELTASLDDWARAEEMMDWFLLVYYSLAEDSAGKNSYLYHDPDSDRFVYIPWDFNHAWGQNWRTYRTEPSSLNTYTGTNRIFWALQSDADSSAVLWERYASMRTDGPMNPAWLTQTVDAYYTQIEPSAARDWARWGADYESYSGWSSARSGTWTDYEGEKTYLYQWLSDRAAQFDTSHPL